MPSHTDPSGAEPSGTGPAAASHVRDLTRLSLLTAAALILFLLESFAPRPLPWMKLGLGNTAVLLALLLYGGRAAAGVAALKVVIGSLITGAFAGPAFVLAGGATVVAVSTMAAARRFVPGVSPLGISVAGAVGHQATQLLLATLYLGHGALLDLMPLFILSGVLAGVLTGVVALACVDLLARRR